MQVAEIFDLLAITFAGALLTGVFLYLFFGGE
jgi:hypothetical protein